ncbi:MAG: antibiotic biosynthesis monooxygenase [Myxococcota bacterium]|nr:antibiotic biosynthesis monooxygenase [Myxococcota bacterium]
MAVYVLLEGTLKEGEVESFTELCREAFKVTRAFDGCQEIHLTLNVENPHEFVLNELWDSKEHYEKYLAFRMEDGTVKEIGSHCDDGPSIRIFDKNSA